MTLGDLIDKDVYTADGHCVGRVYDFSTEGEGPETVVTKIGVGAGAWAGRLHLRGVWRKMLSRKEMDLPWEAMASVDDAVHLDEGWDKARCEECRKGAKGAGKE